MDTIRATFRLGTLGLLAASTLPGCREQTRVEPIRPVRAVKVGDVASIGGRAFPGLAKATEEVNLSFRVSGPLITFPVNVGDTAQKGAIVATIDPRDFQVRLRSAEADLARAKANLEAMKSARPEEITQLEAELGKVEADYRLAYTEYRRNAEAFQKQAIAEAQLDRSKRTVEAAEAKVIQARENLRIGKLGAREEDIAAKEAEIESLEAAVDAANDELEYTRLRAPFSGRVAATYVENYETVQAKQPILRLLDTARIEMKIDVPESLISLVPYVKDVICTFKPSPQQEITANAEIKEIGTEASRTTRTYPVTLIMDQPAEGEILPGMAGVARGRGELPGDVGQRGFEVPESAVFSGQGGEWYVWPIERDGNGKAKIGPAQEVTRGKLTPRGILVKGVTVGQWVATAGVHYLHEGQAVRIIDEPAKEQSK